MNIDEIKQRVAEIDATKEHPEIADLSEIELMDDFIKYIADNGPADLAEMADEDGASVVVYNVSIGDPFLRLDEPSD